MKSSLLRLLVCAALTCIIAAPCFAKVTKKATPAPVHEPTITNVSGNTITVTDDKSARAITVSSVTEVIVNGQKGTIADLKPGMTVSLTLSGPTQASRVVANTKVK